jgi:circadian clock protein KaiC
MREKSEVSNGSAASKGAQEPVPADTGIDGLDAILGGGLQRHQAYLVQGNPGSGKTTLGLQFCMAGARQGERVLYLTTCETVEEVRLVARAHGWSLGGIEVHYHDARQVLGDEKQQSVFHPAEVELPRTIEALLSVIDQINPERLVIDSLSEIRLLAGDPRWFRRQVLALKQALAGRRCTTLFCDDRQDPGQPLQSIVHGVIELEQVTPNYGPDRRRLCVAKLRGQSYSSGYHDFKIRTGGIEVFPRLVAAEHRARFEPETISSGQAELDALFGGGADRGTATLLLGPAGTGKSIVASQYAVAAAGRGERSAMYIFDEREQTLLERAKGLGLDLEGQVAAGLVEIQQIDPAELSPGEFSQTVHRAVVEQDVRLVILDSLSGYFHAMLDERSLTLLLHELLSYLSQRGVSVFLVMSQHGLPGAARYVEFDLSYIADSVLLFHAFEFSGEIRKAISVYKRRGGAHERKLRELRFGPEGIQIGDPLRQFQGLLTGTPTFVGQVLPDVMEQ